MNATGKRRKNKQKMVIIIAFLFVPVILLVMFTYYPAFKLFQLSFTNWDGMRPYLEYTGFKNYIDIFTDSESLTVFTHNFAHVIVMLAYTALALYLAIILDGQIKARNFFKSIIFMPYILNGVAVAFMFSYLYDFQNGPLNILLRSTGLGKYAIKWLGNGYYINFSLALIGSWMYLGFVMVIFLGGLQSVSRELYEAASIDGANFFQNIRYITIPGIKRVIELMLFLGFSGALQAYFQPFVITHGGPAGMSDTFVSRTLIVAFDYQNFGKASAMGVLLIFIILAVVGVQRKVIRYEVE